MDRPRLAPAAIGGLILSLILLRDTAFVWEYLWGPIYAAALGVPSVTRHGITAVAGYNPVNEVFYAVLAALFLYSLVDVLGRFDVAVDWSFITAALPFMVFGALLRVVEDTGFVPFPYAAAIISPFIYFVLAAVALGVIAACHRAAQQYDQSFHRLFAASGGLLTLVPVTVLGWYGWTQGIDPAALPAIGFVAGVVIAGLGVRELLTGIRWRSESLLHSPVSRIVIGAHIVDGAATAYAIDLLGYGEKHPVSLAVMELTGSPYGFLAVKFAFALAICALLEDEPDRFGVLVLLAIVAVGLGPGLRNLARAVLGI